MGGIDMNIDPRLRGEDWEEESSEEEEEVRQLGYNPQASDAQFDPQLGHDRREKKRKLQQRFEHIFDKYGRDFEGVGDEIDIETGLILVDNGHLKNMRHEVDPGNSSESVQALPQNSQHPGEIDEPGAGGSDAESEKGLDDADGPAFDDQGSTSGDNNNGYFSAREQTAGSDTSPSEAEDSAPEPGLNKSSSRRIEDPPNDVDSDEELTAEPGDILSQIPSLRASMLDIQTKHKSGQGMDQDAIQALGMSIAKQVANFVNQDNCQTPKSKRKSANDSIWNYPDLPPEGDYQPQQKKRRVRSPSPFPYYTGPSPGQKSLWAPMAHPRPRKKYKRRNADPPPEEPVREETESWFITENGGSIPEPEMQTEGGIRRTCCNCQCSNSLIWRKGPDGMLCNACGMYYYRYGLIRPFEPQSESEGSDMSDESEVEIERQPAEYSANTSRRLNKDPQNVRFKLDEDALIIRLKEIDRLSWEKIAKHFPGRTAYGVQCRYSKKLHARPVEARAYLVNQGYEFRHDENGVINFTPAPPVPKVWTEEEDDLLLKLREGDGLEWEQVAQSFPGRTAKAMERRYKYLARKITENMSGKPKRKGKKRPDPVTRMFMRYSEKEDELLVKLREDEKLSWEEVAQRFPGRNAMALQKRYVRELAYKNKDLGVDPLAESCGLFLRSNPLKHSRYIAEEDDMLLRLRDDLGLEWKEIQEKMPGRKSQSLENRYQYLKMKKDIIRPTQDTGPDGTPGAGSSTQPNANGEIDGAHSEDELVQDSEEPVSAPEFSGFSVQPGPLAHAGSSSENPICSSGQKTARTSAENPQSEVSPGANTSVLRGIASRRAMRWTEEERDMVLDLHSRGLSFFEMETMMPWRTANAIKNFYNATVRQDSKRKTLPDTQRPEASLLRQAVDNNMRRHSESLMPPANTCDTLRDLTADEVGEEALIQADRDISEPNAEAITEGNESRVLTYPETPHHLPEHSHPSTEPSFGAMTTANYFTPIRYNYQVHPYYIAPPAQRHIPSLTEQKPSEESSLLRAEVAMEDSEPQLAPQPKAVARNARYATRSTTALAQSEGPPALPLAGRDIVEPNIAVDDTTVYNAETRFYEELVDAANFAHENVSIEKETTTNEKSTSNEQPVNNKLPGGSTDKEQPTSYSWTDLANIALRSNASKPMRTREIFDYIHENFPSYTEDSRQWKGSVRSSLTNGKTEFVKIGKDSKLLWALRDPEQQEVGWKKAGRKPGTPQSRREKISIPTENSKEVTIVGEAATDEDEATEQSVVDGEEPDVSDQQRLPLPPVDLAIMALKAHAPNAMYTRDMIKYVLDQFPYLKDNRFHWKDGIRSSVSSRPEFVKVSNDFAALWALDNPAQRQIGRESRGGRARSRVGTPEQSLSEQSRKTLEPDHEEAARPSREPYRTRMAVRRDAAEAEKENTAPSPEVEEAPESDLPILEVEDKSPPPAQSKEPEDRQSSNQSKASATLRAPYRTRRALRIEAANTEKAHVAPLSQAEGSSEVNTQVLEAEKRSLSPTALKEPDGIQSFNQSEAPAPVRKNDLEAQSDTSIHAADSDINGDPKSTSGTSSAHDSFMDAIDPLQEDMSEMSNVSQTLLSSSSPILSMKTPGSVYGKLETPGTGRSTLFGRPQHRGVTALRSSLGDYSRGSRSSSVALPDSTKRVVYTPVRDVEGSEDELS